MTTSNTHVASAATYTTAPNLSIDIGDTALAYRDLGPRDGVPVVLLNHWGAVLDNFDPRIVDGLASRHRVRSSTRPSSVNSEQASENTSAMVRQSVSEPGSSAACYAIAGRQVAVIVSARRNAKPWADAREDAQARNEILRAPQKLGRAIWKKWSGERLLSPPPSGGDQDRASSD